MRRSGVAWVSLLAVCCAHAPPPGPSLAGSVGAFHFDRVSVTGPSIQMSRSGDDEWLGRWSCRGRERQGTIPVSDDAFQVGQVRYGLVFTPRYVAVHETDVDLVLRREDGGPIPHELLIPLWLALRGGALCSRLEPPSNSFVARRCIAVEGIGVVEALIITGRVEQTALEPPRCHDRIGEAPAPHT